MPEVDPNEKRPRPNDVMEFIRIYRPCRRSVTQSLRLRSSMREAWDRSRNGEWLVWILDRLAIPHPETNAIRAELGLRVGPRPARVRGARVRQAQGQLLLASLAYGLPRKSAELETLRQKRQKVASSDEGARARAEVLAEYAARIRAIYPNPFREG